MLAAVTCLGLSPIWFRGREHPRDTREAAVHTRTKTMEFIPGTDIRLLTDEELLSLCSGRPVAWIGQGDQRSFIVLDAFRASK